jgi:hypothetical protein
MESTVVSGNGDGMEIDMKPRQGDNSPWSQACAIREFLFGFK